MNVSPSIDAKNYTRNMKYSGFLINKIHHQELIVDITMCLYNIFPPYIILDIIDYLVYAISTQYYQPCGSMGIISRISESYSVYKFTEEETEELTHYEKITTITKVVKDCRNIMKDRIEVIDVAF